MEELMKEQRDRVSTTIDLENEVKKLKNGFDELKKQHQEETAKIKSENQSQLELKEKNIENLEES